MTTVKIDLPDEQAAALTAKATARGISAEQYAREVIEEDLKDQESKRRRHISDVIRENMSDMPADILAQLPKDGASQHDHYIYGSPKRER